MKITTPRRVLKFNDQELADLNPTAPMQDVMRMHALTIPELSTAILEGPTLVDGSMTYVAQTRLGTKG
jgi:PRTRC genetic system protein C